MYRCEHGYQDGNAGVQCPKCHPCERGYPDSDCTGSTAEHPYPFAEEINEELMLCNCCEACTNQCADDI
jgi:hypothetical protein